MGQEIALTFGRAGGAVAVVERRAPAAHETVEAIRGAGASAEAYVCDVSSWPAVNATVDEIVRRFTKIDILVNNAGIATYVRPLESISIEDWNAVIAVNLTGTFNLMRAVLPLMKARRSGRIVNISSSAGRSVSTFASAAYTASKSGVLGLTRHAAYEAAPHNVTVNAIAPGTIDTPLLHEAASDERIAAEANKIPLRRLGTTRDIADLVAFLASPAAAYITGATVDINGGDLIL
jgi:NAD(P)-dependent dehydrogenase (short-subunit alcohol dehydrogenase family)